MTKNKQKLFVHWWEDSSNRHSCHKNERGLSADESYLGHIMMIPEMGKVVYYYVLREDDERYGPYEHLHSVRKALMDAVGGSILNTWD